MKIDYLDLGAMTAMHGDEIRQAVERVVDSGWYLLGRQTQEFEQLYADYIGTKHCIGCANGLDALTLILRAYMEMGLMKEGDEVIVPANTYIASMIAVTRNGLKAVLVEPDEHTLQMDSSLIEQAITPRTRAVMIVHLYGRCAYTQQIADICRRHDLKLIEDNAHAHGARVETKLTGSLCDAAGHSFYPGKNLGALGDGGAITTDDDRLAEVVRALANYGSSRKYVFPYVGYNSRLDEVQAAVLKVKLKYLDAENDHRRSIAQRYLEGIKNSKIRLPYEGDYCLTDSEVKSAEVRSAEECSVNTHSTEIRSTESNVFHVFPIFCEERDHLQQYLAEHGVQTLIHYPIPPHRQECYCKEECYSKEECYINEEDCSSRECYDSKAHDLAVADASPLVLPAMGLPITERIHREELSLPCNPTMTLAQADEIIKLLNEYNPIESL